MCGRYRQTRHRKQLEEAFDGYFDADDIEIAPRYNIAPTQPIVTVRQELGRRQRRLSLMRWGLVPSWAQDLSIGSKTINARAETAASLPTFRDAFKSQRCLIPADGFYEWQKRASRKIPFLFEMPDGKLFAFAGLWDAWRNPAGEIIESCTILTTKADSAVSDVHDRMPVIVSPENYTAWLDPQTKNAGDLLKSSEAKLERHAVDSRVNNTANDDAQCAEPPTFVEPQRSLFEDNSI